MKRRTPEEARNRMNSLSDALIGAPDEIGEDEAEQALCEAGLDTEALQERVYQRLYAEAQQYWMAHKDLPPLLKKALDDLRPLSAPPRTEAELARQAKTSVERIVEKAVKGMLPHNHMSRKIIKRLKVYPGAEHPHAAQAPKTIELA